MSIPVETMSSTQYPGATPLSPVILFPSQAEARTGIATENVRHVEIAVGLAERLLDFLAVVAAVWASYWIHAAWREGPQAHYSDEAVLITASGFALLMVLLLDKHGDYKPCLSLMAVRETERLLRVTIAGFLLALPILLAVTRSIPRTAIGLALVMVPAMLGLEKLQVQAAIQIMHAWGAITRKAVILGTGPVGRSIYSTLVHSPKFGLDPVAFVELDEATDEPVIYEASYHHNRRANVLPGPVTPRLLRGLGANTLIIAAPEIAPEQVADISAQAEAAGISTYVIPEPFVEAALATEYVELDGILLAHKPAVCPRRWYQAVKRVLDLCLAALSLLMLSPVLLGAALAVRLTSAGPAIFTQRRVGRNGELFSMYKLRSMYADSDRYANSPTSSGDARITPVGRFLRRSCIDELPQLLNVLRGEMSIVGPRPEMPFIVDQYEKIHWQRLTVKPGITGLWQLSADRRSPIHKNIAYDLYYLRHRNLLMDVAIMLHTVVFAFRGV